MRPAMTEDELWHFGIKGMRWGVRRFQNPDGTRTPAGLKRYHDKPAFMSKRKYKKIQKQQAAQQEKRKSISEMSDEELDYAIRRKQKERQLEVLLRDPQVQAKGQSKVKSVLKEAGLKLVKDAAYKIGMDKVEKVLKSKDPDVKLERMAKELKYNTDTHNLTRAKHDFERSKARESYSDEREDFDLRRDKFKLDKEEYNFNRQKAKDARDDWNAQHFYYQPKPSTYPQLPGPVTEKKTQTKTWSVKKKKKK